MPFPRNDAGRPDDTILAGFGTEFYQDVANCNRHAALTTLQLIEARSTVLLKEMGILV